MWHIELFGRLSIRPGAQNQQAGTEVGRFRTQKTALLLAYLALHRQESPAREALIELLWPGVTIEGGRNNLSVALNALRKLLEPTGISAGSVVIADRWHVHLNPEMVSTDVADFELGLKSLARVSEETEMALPLKRIVDIYRGPLLAGYYDGWIMPERVRLTDAYLNALRFLVKKLAQANDFEQAIEYAHRAVQADPLREEARRNMMRLLLKLGRPAAALEQYHDFAQRLQSEMGWTPSAATQELATQITQAFSRGAKTAGDPDPSESAAPLPALSAPSASASPSCFPRALNKLVGRQQERWEIAAFLNSERLVTLTGSGGIGKTRLAIAIAEEVADTYAAGVWFMDLAPVSDPASVMPVLASSLGMRDQPEGDLAATLAEYLRAKPILLIIDNCEHLIEVCARMASTLLGACPDLRILATSRQALGIAGERVYKVSPLLFPPPGLVEHAKETPSVLLEYEAVQIFVERAQQALMSFKVSASNLPAIVQIVQYLEGIPLAIELAAARVKALPPEQIVARLQDSLRLLNSGSRTAMPRQQTLRATLDWSYALLSGPEKRLLGLLAVFAGGWTLEAAEAVCCGNTLNEFEVLDLLTQLVDKSLVVYEDQHQIPRYRLLVTLRLYCEEKLAGTEELANVHKKHADYFGALIEANESITSHAVQDAWFHRVETEYANLRAALDWCLSLEEERAEGSLARIETGLRLAVGLYPFWSLTSFLREGRQILETLLDMSAFARPALRANALYAAGCMAISQGVNSTAQPYLEEALIIAVAAGNSVLEAESLCQIGILAWDKGDYSRADATLKTSLALFRHLNNRKGIAMALGNLGNVASRQGNLEEAEALCQECLALCEQQDDRHGMAYTLKSLGKVAYQKRDWKTARAYHERSLAIWREMGYNWGVATALGSLGSLACEEGDYRLARGLLAESLDMRQAQKDVRGLIDSFEKFARLNEAEGRFAHAVTLSGAVEALSAALQTISEREDAVSVLKERLSTEAFASAWEKGRAMTLEQAAAFARQESVAG